MAIQFLRNINTKQIILTLLGIIFLVGILLRLEALFSVMVNQWVVRDFDRAFSIAEGVYFPLAGSELGNGGRIPGPFMYFFLALPLLFNKTYESIFVFNLILNVASIIFIFFTIKKNLNILTASITAAFISINFHHIEAVLFPINPAFIFPFIALYVWLLFDFIIKENNKSLLLLVLLICLTLQFHFSIITYVIAPIILALIFKIRIPIKIIFAGIAIVGICFVPYLIYKKQTFVPTNVGGIQSHGVPDFSSISSSIKTIAIQGTITRIVKSYGLISRDNEIPKQFFVFFRVFLSISFYFLVFHVFSGGFKNALENRRKEIIVLSMFYFPSLSYEMYGPYIGHYWYEYIFVVPQSLVMGLFLTVLSEKIASSKFKTIYLSGVGFSLILLSGFAFYTAKKSDVLSPEKFNAERYKTVRSLAAFLMQKTNLSPEEYMNNVFIQGFNPQSRKIFNLIKSSEEFNLPQKQSSNSNKCFFIDQIKPKNKQFEFNKNRFLSYDPSIKITNQQTLSFPEDTQSLIFEIYEYSPIEKQPCYQNVDNPFFVIPRFRDLVRDASKLERNPLNNVVELVEVEKKETYDNDDELKHFFGNYIIGNETTQVPFRFKLDLKKVNNKYLLKGDFEIYYFWGTPNFRLVDMQVLIKRKSQPKTQFNAVSIISPNKIINSVGSLNLLWSKEAELPNLASLKKDDLDINLFWRIEWKPGDSICCRSQQVNYLSLIEKYKPGSIS